MGTPYYGDNLDILRGYLAISLIKNRLQDTCGSRRKFVVGGASSAKPTSPP